MKMTPVLQLTMTARMPTHSTIAYESR